MNHAAGVTGTALSNVGLSQHGAAQMQMLRGSSGNMLLEECRRRAEELRKEVAIQRERLELAEGELRLLDCMTQAADCPPPMKVDPRRDR